ncbi:MAG: hypothetical protein AAB428_03205 [Patescibacteria group bacterium]
MKIVTVIPITKGVFKDTLTYWSGKDISPGAIVSVMVRSRKVNAVIVSVEEVSNAKASVKNAPFVLKKIGSVKPGVFLPEFINAAKRSAEYFVAPVGSVIQSFVPKAVLDSPLEIPVRKEKKHSAENASVPKLKIEKLICQSEDEDRLAAYKSLVREEFARKASVFICFPTGEDVLMALSAFEKGIKEYTFALHGRLSKKALLGEWQRALKENHPIVILGTASFLGLPRGDIKTLIIEKENSRHYKTIGRPEIDIRKFAEHYAEERNLRFIMGDIFLRTETLYRYHEHELLPFTSVKFRSLWTASGTIVDMKAYPGKTAGKPFVLISNELEALIELSRRENDHLAILVGRRGIAGVTVCNDCGKILSCENCGAPLVLHQKKEGRFFLCHKCGNEKKVERDGEERCLGCGSWRLVSLGIGVERIIEEISSELPGLNIFRIDSDTVKTSRGARKIASDFYGTQGALLVGTEMMLPYLYRPVESSAIVGIDSFLTIPDFRINEKIFSLILSLRAKTQKTILLQTQESERSMISQGLRGDILSFYREEVGERKKFGYPPFVTLVKISWDAKRDHSEKEMGGIAKLFDGYAVRSYATSYENTRISVRAHVLIKIPQGKWVDEKILGKLKALSPKYTVSVDPDSIL